MVGLSLAVLVAVGAGCTVDLEAGQPPAQMIERSFERTIPAVAGRPLEIENLAGSVRLEVGTGDDVELRATIHAGGDDESAAAALADLLEIQVDERQERVVVAARFPVERHTSYHYPRPGQGGSIFAMFGSSTTVRYQGRRVTVSSDPRAGAATLYVDFQVFLPPDVGAEVRNVVGPIDAEGVRGDLSLDTASGDIYARDGVGRLELDTGSGDILVESHEGDIAADTGSGDVEVRGARGNVRADTGSGDVFLEDVEGDDHVADTGSGDVVLRRVRGSISADTGSGDVQGSELGGVVRLRCDTGSGSLSIAGDLSALVELVLETGSGDIELELTADVPALRLSAATASGEIDVDLPGLEIVRRERRRLEARTGDGRVPASIRTSSGDIRVYRR